MSDQSIYADLKQLGSMTELPTDPEQAVLETVNNPEPEVDYVVRFTAPEFTSLCPMTGQPDFAHLMIDYIPDKLLVESKSLKLFLGAFRNHGAFHEAVTNEILDDLVKAIAPKKMTVTGDFWVRGGIKTIITASHP